MDQVTEAASVDQIDLSVTEALAAIYSYEMHNLFAFVHNNPLTFGDAFGLWPGWLKKKWPPTCQGENWDCQIEPGGSVQQPGVICTLRVGWPGDLPLNKKKGKDLFPPKKKPKQHLPPREGDPPRDPRPWPIEIPLPSDRDNPPRQ
jgi:hypothetical protein